MRPVLPARDVAGRWACLSRWRDRPTPLVWKADRRAEPSLRRLGLLMGVKPACMHARSKEARLQRALRRRGCCRGIGGPIRNRDARSDRTRTQRGASTSVSIPEGGRVSHTGHGKVAVQRRASLLRRSAPPVACRLTAPLSAAVRSRGSLLRPWPRPDSSGSAPRPSQSAAAYALLRPSSRCLIPWGDRSPDR